MTRQYIFAADHRTTALGMLSEKPTTLDAIRQAMGFANMENASRIMSALEFAGMVFSCRAKIADEDVSRVLFFSTREARDAYAAAEEERKRERKRASGWRLRRREDQRIAAARKRAERKVAADSRKAAKDAALKEREDRRAEREKAERDRQAALKARQRALKPVKSQQPVVLAGTHVTKIARVIGPAHRPGPADESKARRIEAPKPVERYAVSEAPKGGFSDMKFGEYEFAARGCAAKAVAA